jgi:hypothetical protein
MITGILEEGINYAVEMEPVGSSSASAAVHETA